MSAMAELEPLRCRVTVVIATRNRRDELLRTLAQLGGLPQQPAIIVVDNGSSDGTANAARQLERPPAVVRLEHDLGAGARNVGIERSQTPYVALCDDDSWWAPGALERAASLLDTHPDVALLAARVHVGPEQALESACSTMRATPLQRGASNPGAPVLGFVACAAVMRRDAYLAVGGFRRELGIGGEEQLLAVDLAAAGWKIAYVDELLAHHHPSSHRNKHRREVVVARNALWFCWLRRPARTVLVRTADALWRSLRDRSQRAAVIQAVHGLPWVLRSRRRLPAEIERDLRLIERAERDSHPSIREAHCERWIRCSMQPKRRQRALVSTHHLRHACAPPRFRNSSDRHMS